MRARWTRVGMQHACNEHVCARKGLCRRRLCRRRCSRQFASIRAVQVYGYGQIWCRRVVSWCICHGSMSNALSFCRPKIVVISLLALCDPRAVGAARPVVSARGPANVHRSKAKVSGQATGTSSPRSGEGKPSAPSHCTRAIFILLRHSLTYLASLCVTYRLVFEKEAFLCKNHHGVISWSVPMVPMPVPMVPMKVTMIPMDHFPPNWEHNVGLLGSSGPFRLDRPFTAI